MGPALYIRQMIEHSEGYRLSPVHLTMRYWGPRALKEEAVVPLRSAFLGCPCGPVTGLAQASLTLLLM